MTRKPRSAYKDRTRATRAARRQAILDAAARRMGVNSWSGVESWVRQALEDAATDEHAAARLNSLFYNLSEKIKAGDPERSPADMVEILEKYPIRQPGPKRPTPEVA